MSRNSSSNSDVKMKVNLGSREARPRVKLEDLPLCTVFSIPNSGEEHTGPYLRGNITTEVASQTRMAQVFDLRSGYVQAMPLDKQVVAHRSEINIEWR